MKKETVISWERLPETYDDFIGEAREKLYDPESAAALFICALKVFMSDMEEGRKCINLLTYNKEDAELMYFPRLQQIRKTQNYLPDSYFKGTKAENMYIVGESPSVSILSDNARGLKKDMKTVYVGCEGSGNYRPVTLKRIREEKADEFCRELKPENFMWFVSDFVSVLSDVRRP